MDSNQGSYGLKINVLSTETRVPVCTKKWKFSHLVTEQINALNMRRILCLYIKKNEIKNFKKQVKTNNQIF